MLVRMSSPTPGRRALAPRLLTVLALPLSVALAACGHQSSAPQPEKSPDSQPVQGGAQLAALWPLTGQRAHGPTPKRPVLVVKIDNTDSSRPQIGTGKADLVTEELVEGGITRLAVFFYQHLPSVAGPVRSMRASDLGVVEPAHGVLVASGGAPPTVARIKGAKVPFFAEGGPGYFRVGGRQAPYNLMVRLPQLAKAVAKKAVVPPSYLPWGSAADYHGRGQARSINAIFSRSHTTAWKFQGGHYVNQNSNATSSDHFTPDTILVLRVREGDAGYRDPAGNHVPETLYSGSGPMMMFHGGKVERGTWTKAKRETPLQLNGPQGPIKVPAGHTWVELVPNDKSGGNVTFAK